MKTDFFEKQICVIAFLFVLFVPNKCYLDFESSVTQQSSRITGGRLDLELLLDGSLAANPILSLHCLRVFSNFISAFQHMSFLYKSEDSILTTLLYKFRKLTFLYYLSSISTHFNCSV